MQILGGCPVSRKILFRGVNFGENRFFSSWDGALAFKKIRGPIWRPEDQFGGIWWWSEFPIFPKTWKSTSPMPCKTKPCQSSRESLRMVHAMPPDIPRPPKYHLKLWKHLFLWKKWFTVFLQFLLFFCPIGSVFGPIGPTTKKSNFCPLQRCQVPG